MSEPRAPTAGGARTSAAIAAFTMRWIGLDIERDAVFANVERHIERRCALLGVTVERYLATLCERPLGAEAQGVVEAATVPHTWLFRDTDPLVRTIERLRGRTAPARVWVAGCASGEEAFTIAMLAAKAGVPLSVVATDIRPSSIAVARTGRYPRLQARAMPAWVTASGLVHALPDGSFEVSESIRAAVRFDVVNLLEIPASMEGFDAIVCRNVLLYFSAEHAQRVHDRLLSSLAPGGELVLGPCDGFRLRLPMLDGMHASEPQAMALPWPPPLPPPAPPGPAFAPAVPPPARAATEEPSTAIEDGLDAEAKLMAGVAALARDDLEEAAAALRAAAFLEPSFGLAHYELGVCLERLGEWDRAERAFRRAAECPRFGGMRGRTELPSALVELAADLRTPALRRIELLARGRERLAERPPRRPRPSGTRD